MEPLTEYKAALGSRIREMRTGTGLSLRGFGLMADVHYNQLLRIEQGKANPSLETLYKIAAGLGVDVAELLGGKPR